MSDRPDRPDTAPERITPEFRNGSLTAISLIVGFSLSFLSRWAGTPGQWHNADLFAVALIVLGSAAQIWSLGPRCCSSRRCSRRTTSAQSGFSLSGEV